MNILLTNDDGIHSKALLALTEALKPFADLIVVAPRHEQSGVGHAFSYYGSVSYGPATDYPCPAYWLKGTPADCVKFAVCEICKENPPDLVISGINNGENAGVAVVYSGTLAGAREAALWNVPAIALSAQEQLDHVVRQCIDWVVRVVREAHWKNIPRGLFWTANFPAVPPAEYKGMRVCCMSTVMFTDEYLRVVNPRQQAEYWLTGFKNRPEFPEGSDDWWLAQGYATLTPLQVDQTAYPEIQKLQSLVGLTDLE
ncbi:MAG TPA: 5'/3'-nucleotidase SurE [Fibrobacteraceae bacterium]|nr:5'/3'-nucleotidase SurE [Fibrobacteraceae bacterium]